MTTNPLAWLCLGALLGACDGSAEPPPPPGGRVQAVAARAPGARDLAGFCDSQPTDAATLTLPPLSGGVQPAASGARWLNLWATWCKPCIEELPMIAAWQAQWRKQGAAAEVYFVSVDAEPELLDAYLKAHPEMPPTERIEDAEALAPWMQQAGFDAGAGLPLHVFTDAAGKPLCLRAGAVLDAHRPIVEKLLSVDG